MLSPAQTRIPTEPVDLLYMHDIVMKAFSLRYVFVKRSVSVIAE